jgi:hypothetical protein
LQELIEVLFQGRSCFPTTTAMNFLEKAERFRRLAALDEWMMVK